MAVDIKNVMELVEAAMAADYTRVRRTGNRIAKELETDKYKDEAKKLRSLIRKSGVPLETSGYVETLPVDSKSRLPLLDEQDWPVSPIFLNENAKTTFDTFIEDVSNADLLHDKGLATRFCLLLSGEPGTGKSLLAGHIASRLNRPLYVIRLDSVISSLLGDTAKNIRSVFDFVPSQNAVLFLDEMDAVAKLRDDRHELGEIKRVVNTVIQGLDSLSDNAVVIAATNHPHLLDPAIWRRFPYKIDMDLPNSEIRADMWQYFLYNDEDSPFVNILALASKGLSGAEIENIALAARRRSILTEQPIDTGAVAWAVFQTAKGKPTTPPSEGLTSQQKIELSSYLCNESTLSQADVARILGVTRQAVGKYLKGYEHVH